MGHQKNSSIDKLTDLYMYIYMYHTIIYIRIRERQRNMCYYPGKDDTVLMKTYNYNS